MDTEKFVASLIGATFLLILIGAFTVGAYEDKLRQECIVASAAIPAAEVILLCRVAK